MICWNPNLFGIHNFIQGLLSYNDIGYIHAIATWTHKIDEISGKSTVNNTAVNFDSSKKSVIIFAV